jgi:fibronectin-binding autotransporter adhesin
MLPPRISSVASSLLVLAALLLAAPFAAGQTWTATSSGNWSTASNWNNGAGPAPTSSSTTVLTFSPSGTTSYTATNNISNPFVLENLNLDSTSSATNTIAGSQLQFANLGGISVSGTGNWIVSNPILIAPGGTFNVSNVSVAGLTLSGVISGTGTFSTLSGQTVTLTNAGNTYSGGTSLVGSTLIISADGNLGAVPGSATPGSILLNGGDLTASSSFTLNSNRGIALGPASGTGSGRITVNSGATLTYNGIIANNGTSTSGFTFLGPGTLDLSGSTAANTYSGPTTIGSGTLMISSDSTLGAVPGSPTANSLVLEASGILSATSSFTLSRNRGIALFGQGGISVAGGQTVQYAGIIADSSSMFGGLIKQGSGTLVLSGLNTYTGGTTISGGTLSISSDRNLGADPSPSPIANDLVINGGTLNASAGFILNHFRGIVLGPTGGSGSGTIDVSSGKTLIYNGIIADNYGGGIGSLIKSNSGTLTLGGANTYSGGTTINGGTLSISSDGNLGSVPGSATPGSLVINGGTLNASSSFTLNSNRGIALGPTSGSGAGTIDVNSSQTLTYNGIIADNGGIGSLIKTSAGTLVLGGANTYSGSTTINGGTLSISSDGNLGGAPSQVSLTINGGTLQTTAGFTLYANRAVSLGSSGGTFDVEAGTLSYGGGISGSGNLTKIGPGTLNLYGANTDTGNTTINAGTLSLTSNGSISTPNSTVTLGSSGTLTLNGGSVTTKNFDNSAGGTVNLYDGTLTVSGGNFNWGSNPLNIDANTAGKSPSLILNALTNSPSFSNEINVGNSIQGSLKISGGTQVSISNIVNIATGTGSTGSLTVTDPGSSLAVTGGWYFALGSANSTGTLTVQNQGTASASTIYGASASVNVLSGGNLSSTYGFIGTGTVDGTGSVLSLNNLDLYGNTSVTNGGKISITGTTTLHSGSSLNVGAGSAVTGGSMNVAGLVQGLGSISGPVTLQPGGTIMAGPNSSTIGTLSLGTSLTFQAQSGNSASAMAWKLGSLNDSASVVNGAGSAWDRISLNAAGSNLSIDPTAQFVIEFIGAASTPGVGEDNFWRHPHTWQDVILTTSAPTGNGVFTIDNSAWVGFGTFSTAIDSDPGIDLIWTPDPSQVPEPSSLLLCGLSAAGAAIYRWRRRSAQAASQPSLTP